MADQPFNPSDPGFQAFVQSNFPGVLDGGGQLTQSMWDQYLQQGGTPQAPPPPTPTQGGDAFVPSPLNMTPATIAQQFPNGIPQLNPQQVTGIPQVSAPDLGALPNVSAGQVSGRQIAANQIADPNSIIGGMGGASAYSPENSVAAISGYMQPQFEEQQRALTANLANAGIVGGTAPKASADLGRQQQTTLQNDIQPYILQRLQMQQAATTQDSANSLQTQEANQGANLTAAQLNQGNALQAQGMNQNANLTAQQTNLSAAEQQMLARLQAQMQAQQLNQGAAMQTGQFNVGQANTAMAQNIQNLLNTGQIDAATYNQMLSQISGMQNQDWLAQLGAQTNVATAGMGAQVNAFNPNYQQPSGGGFSGLASAFAQPPNYTTGAATRTSQPSTETPQVFT